MAGLGLAVAGSDGRFLQIGGIRDITGPCTVEQLLAAGVDMVSTFDGQTFQTGTVLAREGKPPRPCPVNGKTVLFVEMCDGNSKRSSGIRMNLRLRIVLAFILFGCFIVGMFGVEELVLPLITPEEQSAGSRGAPRRELYRV